ncbi:MAG: Flp pilus assembly protein CpaB [Hydrogenibacillus schlegelii]|uniref:Flp pilus assembly protein CpaB n=2 Tax=Hydrogenibacillus schlegelii TaxID=1484 RepID=A0A2T5GBK0_HYDSH|nr:Flp pilus assembly protein CpaB [Hydrogenibacillus schlegelii]PTQ53569.1 MAG: Flp pilus assembly protein RcpC/CpaB [Hydrogenibacillus schlegelii]
MLDARRKAIIFFVLALAMATIASAIIVNEWNKVRSAWGETVRVAVAAVDIQPYTAITPEMIDWQALPKQFVTTGFITEAQKLKDSIALVEIQKGDFLTPNIIRARADLSPGERIVWLNISNNVFLDQIVAPGDRVDLIVTHQEEGKLVTERLFSDVLVIQRDTDDKGKMVVKVVLPLSEAERLIYYQNTANQIRVLLSDQIEQRTVEGSGLP